MYDVAGRRLAWTAGAGDRAHFAYLGPSQPTPDGGAVWVVQRVPQGAVTTDLEVHYASPGHPDTILDRGLGIDVGSLATNARPDSVSTSTRTDATYWAYWRHDGVLVTHRLLP